MDRRKFNLMALLSPLAGLLGVKAAPIPKVVHTGFIKVIGYSNKVTPVSNAAFTLKKSDWIEMDMEILKQCRKGMKHYPGITVLAKEGKDGQS